MAKVSRGATWPALLGNLHGQVSPKWAENIYACTGEQRRPQRVWPFSSK